MLERYTGDRATPAPDDETKAPEDEDPDSSPTTIGAITLQTNSPSAYSEQELAYVAIVGDELSTALQNRTVLLPGEAVRPQQRTS